MTGTEYTIENAASCPYATAPFCPKKLKMLTAAGTLSGESSRTNGTKKFPQAWMNTKMNTTAMPGRMSGTTIRVSVVNIEAPSVHAASSSEIGTESMKFFAIQIAIGSEVAARKKMHPHTLSMRLSDTNSA